jgi:decaprenylphospho-beta-D-erythro-pentofuranosid-2-ulose 2-reductase
VIDALGRPQSVLLLGGTSDIGLATVRALVADGLRRVALAGRPSDRLSAAAAELRDLGVASVSTHDLDATRTEGHRAVVDAVYDDGDIDVVVVAIGELGEQRAAEREPELAVHTALVTYVGPMSAMLHVSRRMRDQGHGVVVVLSSVAGVRARRTNFVYGSAKAGLDAFSQGLAAALEGSGVSLVVVRPGFVRTRMTEGLPAAPFATTADAVARAVRGALRRRPAVVWVPGILGPVMLTLRLLPRSVFRRLPG